MTTLYKNDPAGAISYIVYINGLQVPVQSVSVSYGVWQVPQAQITLVPDPVLNRLGAEDRVSVQVFYCDQWYRAPRPEFCLLFDGEITGWGYVSAGSGNMRALSFTCVDYVAILHQLFFYFMSSFDDMAIGASGTELGVMGSTVSLAGYGALYPYSLFSQGLADVDEGAGDSPTIRRPIDFAFNIVRSLIKAQSPNRTVPAANFFAPWTKRTNFHKRWVALPYFDEDPLGLGTAGCFPILRAVRSEQALSAVARQASTTGSGGSMFSMLEEVLKNLMMEVSMIPTPAAVRSDFNTLLPKGHPTESTQGQVFLTNYFVKPQLLFGLPPVCNTFFPPQIEGYFYNENYAVQPTRMYFSEEVMLSYLNPGGTNVSQGLGQLLQDALCTGFPAEVDIAARDATENRGQNGKNLLVYPEEFFKGPVIKRVPLPRWFAFLAQATQTGQGNPDAADVNEESPDGSTVNIADPGETTDIRPIESTDELFGATDAVYNYRGTNFAALARATGAQVRFGALAQGETRNQLRALTSAPLGSIETPTAFPVLERTAARIAGDGTAGAFFAFRTSSGGRLHAGVDIGGAIGLTIVSATGGTVKDIGNNTDTRGYCVEILDTRGGTWRYIHLQEPALVVRGQAVQPGTPLGKLGTTFGPGQRVSPHLHLDATSSRGYRMNFTQALRNLQSGRDALTPTNTQRPVSGARGVASTVPAPQPRMAPEPTALSDFDTQRGIYQLYAAYEYFRERFSSREGSVQMAGFNPYPVPGFPCATFDRQSSACHTVGYLTSVQHNLTPGGWSTRVAFSYGRTFSEMFALMEREAALDRARQSLNVATITGAVTSNVSLAQGGAALGVPGEADNETTRQNAEALLDATTLPIGTVAMAPAEPIPEIRSVIQNFDTANEFYKGLFYHGTFVGQDRLAAEDAARLRGDTADLYLPYADAQAIVRAREQGATQEELDAMVQAFVAVNASLRSSNAATARLAGQDATLARRAGAQAVLEYPNIVEMLTLEGERIPIRFEGVTATTRSRMLGVISAIRSHTATEEDLAFLRSATGNTAIRQPVNAGPLPEDLSSTLLNLEVELRTSASSTNVRGDTVLVPRVEAEPLFESHAAAMGFVGRPICTLDEYVEFLGEDGLREGTVHPNVESVTRSSQLHPAHYYTRIRRYRPGPPDRRPVAGTNTRVSTDAAAGGTAVVERTVAENPAVQEVPSVTGSTLPDGAPTVAAAEPPPPAGVYYVDPVPQSFPDNRAAWDAVLEEYRDRVLNRLAPRS